MWSLPCHYSSHICLHISRTFAVVESLEGPKDRYIKGLKDVGCMRRQDKYHNLLSNCPLDHLSWCVCWVPLKEENNGKFIFRTSANMQQEVIFKVVLKDRGCRPPWVWHNSSGSWCGTLHQFIIHSLAWNQNLPFKTTRGEYNYFYVKNLNDLLSHAYI